MLERLIQIIRDARPEIVLTFAPDNKKCSHRVSALRAYQAALGSGVPCAVYRMLNGVNDEEPPPDGTDSVEPDSKTRGCRLRALICSPFPQRGHSDPSARCRVRSQVCWLSRSGAPRCSLQDKRPERYTSATMLRQDMVGFLEKSFPPALAASATLFLTGEIGYHSGMNAAESGLATVAFGHRETERPFVPHVAKLLRERFSGVEVEER